MNFQSISYTVIAPDGYISKNVLANSPVEATEDVARRREVLKSDPFGDYRVIANGAIRATTQRVERPASFSVRTID